MPEQWEVDDIIQISPTHDERFGAALMVVTEVKPWGVVGYVQIPARGQAYYRLPFESTKEGCSVTGQKVGRAFWLLAPKD